MRWFRWTLVAAVVAGGVACTGELPRPPASETPVLSPSAVTSGPISISPQESPSPPESSPGSPTPQDSPFPSGITGTFLEVLRDDMSDPRSGFPTVDDLTQRVVYEEGALRMDLRMPGRATWTTRDIGDWPLADVEGSLSTVPDSGPGFHGLTCGVDQDDFYAGVVGTDGTALLLRVEDGVATRLAQQASAIVLPIAGALQAFGLRCVGTDAGGTAAVTLTVGGMSIIAATDAIGFAGFQRAGYYAESAPSGSGSSVRADDFLVTVGLRAEPGGGASPTQSLTGDPEADALASRVPEERRATCRLVEQTDFLESVAIDCPTAEVTSAVYLEYATTDAMEADFRALVTAHPEADGPDCRLGPGAGPYQVDGTEVGGLLCFEEIDAAVFVWTDTRLVIMGYARRPDGSFDALYDWWLLAGPVP